MKLGVEDIYAEYKKKINKDARLTAQARAKIVSRLKEFSFEELTESINKFSNNVWRMENNSSKGMVWFFKGEEQVSTWLSLKEDKVEYKKNVLQKDNTESDWIDAQLQQKKFREQSPKDKAIWWFKYSYSIHYGLRAGGGLNYESVKEKMGRDKMKEVYKFILNWYEKNPKAHTPAKHEYEYLLPEGSEKIEGWTKIGQ